MATAVTVLTVTSILTGIAAKIIDRINQKKK
jgi:hypothetical protein